ncbi:piercer of microtubule wall 1 protein [Megachile rotundata]|uniref:piercer of microtubule wall 1 protein n=1 Tax=Megachile rotundata TaxID=143995 RepID=UPI003FD24C72
MIETPCVCDEKKEEEKTEVSFGPRTDDIYRTCNLPTRFMYPRVFEGYRQDEKPLPHPCYRSTSMDYGCDSQALGGMYRNCSLNTELDKTPI